jgi:hypothetical protein
VVEREGREGVGVAVGARPVKEPLALTVLLALARTLALAVKVPEEQGQGVRERLGLPLAVEDWDTVRETE